MNESGEYFVNTPWGWRERLRYRLFPPRRCPLPEAPPFYQDCLVIKTTAVLGWPDRLRILLTGRLVVETKTVTEGRIGANITASVAFVDVTWPAAPAGEIP